MKLLICLVVVLCVADSMSDPILCVLAGRSLYGRGSLKGRIIGSLLGGGSDSTSEQTIVRRRAPAAAAAPAAAPRVNVNVENVYSNENNQAETNNQRIGAVNNNVANNRYALDQNIDNRAKSNVYNKRRTDNRVINNNYRGNAEPCEDC